MLESWCKPGMQNTEMELMGARLQHLRKKSGYSKEQLAEMLGITWQHLANIENGRRGISTDLACRLRTIFHVSIDYLLTGEEFRNDRDEVAELLESLDPALYPYVMEFILSLGKIYGDMKK